MTVCRNKNVSTNISGVNTLSRTQYCKLTIKKKKKIIYVLKWRVKVEFFDKASGAVHTSNIHDAEKNCLRVN